MTQVIRSVGALLLSAAILLVGGGLLSTLVAVRAEIEGFPVFAIGLLTSAYFAGFMAGCLGTPYLVKRVGHVRVFAALSSLTAAAALIHVLAVNIPSWVVLRALTGFSFAGLYMLIESWINEQAPNESRGQVLSIYRMVDLVAVTLGQFLLSAADPGTFTLFSVVAICISLAIFPLSLSASQSPKPVSETSLNIKKLIRVSPLASIGSFAVGLVSGAFWGIAPIFVSDLGHTVFMISVFMSVVIFAGALLQWPVGWLSDKFGRRILIVIMSICGAGAGVFLWLLGPASAQLMIAGGALYGLFAMQIFGLCAAHANDRAEPHEFIAISGGLLLIYSVGSIIGPVLAPVFMGQFGASALFLYTACVHVLLAIYTLLRSVSNEAPEDNADYVAISRPRSMALMMRVDPRVIRRAKRTKSKNQS